MTDPTTDPTTGTGTPPAGPAPNYEQLLARLTEWEAIIAVAQARKAAITAQLQTDMESEHIGNHAAPSHRTEYGTITLPVTQDGIVLADEAALLAWAQAHHPGEVETVHTVRAGFIARLVKEGTPTPDGLLDPTTGEIIPGFKWRKGGRARTVSHRKNQERLRAAMDAVNHRLNTLSGELPAATEQQMITTRVDLAKAAAEAGPITPDRARQIGQEIAAAQQEQEEADTRPPGPFATDRLLRRIHTLLSKLDPPVTDRAAKLRYLSDLVGRTLKTSRHMTMNEARMVAAVLSDMVTGPPTEPWETDAHPADDPWTDTPPVDPTGWADANPADDPWGT